MKVSGSKLIAIDVDGVLVDWIHSFDTWFRSSGLSAAIGARTPEPNEPVNGYELHSRYELNSEQIATSIRIFNSTIHMQGLPPWEGAVKNIRKLVEDGYTFHALTSFSADFWSHELRRTNLNNIYGPGTFSGFTFLPLRANKLDHLKAFEPGTYWIDDHINHAEDGARANLNSILLDGMKLFSKDLAERQTPFPCHVCHTWDDVYKYITGE